MPPDEDRLAGMDGEGLRRLLGELLDANRATQANFDEIRQQFPIQPSSLADSIPDWSELEEGGLSPPSGEDGEEPESFQEQLGVFADVIFAEVDKGGTFLSEGAGFSKGLTIEHPSTGVYKIWVEEGNDFVWPGMIHLITVSTAGTAAVNGNLQLITSGKGVKGYEIVLVKVADNKPVDANFHFSAANFTTK